MIIKTLKPGDCNLGPTRSSSLLWDKQGRVALLSDTTQGWPLMAWRHSGSGPSTGWICDPLGRLRVGFAVGAGMIASWKRPDRDPSYRRRGLRVTASILLRHRRGWKMGWQSFLSHPPNRYMVGLGTGPRSNGWRTSPDACTTSGWSVARWWMWERMHLRYSCVLWLADSESSQYTPWDYQKTSCW